MNFRTPLFASVAVLSALGGVAAAAFALPSSPPQAKTAAIVPTATATPEARTETVRVVKRDQSTRARAVSTPAATASPSGARAFDDSGHHRGTDDSGHHHGRDDSGHHGGGDSGRGRGRGRGGDDD